MKIQKHMSEHDPIKILTISYLQAILKPYLMSNEKYNLYIDVLHLMLDAAYSHGIEQALSAFQKAQFELQMIPDSTTRIKQSCDILDNYLEEQRQKQQSDPHKTLDRISKDLKRIRK